MSSLRLNRSASLPQMGVEIAVVSSVAVTTHVKAAWSPPMSWMMTGSEVETTVAARIETNIPSRSPDSASSTLRCDMRGASAAIDESSVVTEAMGALSEREACAAAIGAIG